MLVLILCLIALLGVLLEIAYKSPTSFVEMLLDSKAFAEGPAMEEKKDVRRPERIVVWTT